MTGVSRMVNIVPCVDRWHFTQVQNIWFIQGLTTVVPVMNGHPRDQAKVSVHCRWPLIRGNLTLKCVGRGIDNVAVQGPGRWLLTTGVAQGRYYCSSKASSTAEHPLQRRRLVCIYCRMA